MEKPRARKIGSEQQVVPPAGPPSFGDAASKANLSPKNNMNANDKSIDSMKDLNVSLSDKAASQASAGFVSVN